MAVSGDDVVTGTRQKSSAPNAVETHECVAVVVAITHSENLSNHPTIGADTSPHYRSFEVDAPARATTRFNA
jgi:hypothetical protein